MQLKMNFATVVDVNHLPQRGSGRNNGSGCRNHEPRKDPRPTLQDSQSYSLAPKACECFFQVHLDVGYCSVTLNTHDALDQLSVLSLHPDIR